MTRLLRDGVFVAHVFTTAVNKGEQSKCSRAR